MGSPLEIQCIGSAGLLLNHRNGRGARIDSGQRSPCSTASRLPQDFRRPSASSAYQKYFAGELTDETYDAKELAMALAGLPSVPEPA